MKKILEALAWAQTREGKHDIGAALGALAALYSGLKAAGVF